MVDNSKANEICVGFKKVTALGDFLPPTPKGLLRFLGHSTSDFISLDNFNNNGVIRKF